ncbi:glutamate 5-kinase [bacterium]|nr:glutamate 5-kinase [bacterium]
MSGMKTIVVKVGTSTLTQGKPYLSRPSILELVRQLAAVQSMGYRVLLVSSGAMAAGREVLSGQTLSSALPTKQMLCAIGQGQLMRLYSDLFGLYGVRVGQVLVTGEDLLRHRTRYLNARDTLNMLLEYQTIPIINENDTLAVDEIKVGDNDNLSALIASLINADLLLILTDRDGLYNKDPRRYPDAHPIEVVHRLDAQIQAMASGVSSSGQGIGGMATKLQAAEVAGRSGIETVIANGSTRDVILRIVQGEALGTRFAPTAPRVESRKRWLLSELPQGVVQVDEGATAALRQRAASLLPVGIRNVEGQFPRGAVVLVRDLAGQKVAHGLVNYGAEELVRLCGVKSDQIETTLGYSYGTEAIHRDNMAIFKEVPDEH